MLTLAQMFNVMLSYELLLNIYLDGDVCNNTTNTTTVFWDHPREPVPEDNFWTLWCKGRSSEADTPTIWLDAIPS